MCATSATSAMSVFRLGPWSAGLLLTAEEFDAAEFDDGWRYELINAVLVASPTPSRRERDPNEELGRFLRNYQEGHAQGAALDATLAEEMVFTVLNRRWADRVIWAGLGRLPAADETPTIIVEFVSKGRSNRQRDYQAKRAEYGEIGVREYWIVDRFRRTLTVCAFEAGGAKERVLRDNETYTTPLLPGFELPLAGILALADRWPR